MEKKNQSKFQSKRSLLFYFLKGSKRYFVLSILFACVLAVFELINPKIISYTVDNIIGSEGSQVPAFIEQLVNGLGGMAYIREHLYLIAIFVVTAALIAALCRFLSGWFDSIGAEKLVRNMRDSLYEHILHLPYAWHGENQTGDIIQRCTSDVEVVKRFLSEQLIQLFRILLLVTLAYIFMFRINWKLSLVSMIFIPIVLTYSMVFHSKVGSAFEKVDTEEGKLSAIAQENLTGVRVVRAFGRETFERERFEKKNKDYTNMWIRMMRLLASFWATTDFICGAQILLVVSAGVYLAVKGELSTGNYIAFIAYNAMVSWPIRSLGRVISEMSKAGISVSRIQYIMNAEPEADLPDAADFPEHSDVEFDHVSFSFSENANDVLSDVSFRIEEGQTVGILGGTGSGKSTLVHLMTRLYELSGGEGTIRIGGRDIRTLKASELRKNIGLVLQEPYLFSRTLGENIRIASEDYSEQDMRRASRLAALDSAISKFTEGYETPVGERGVTLSGGQKQRTAIAQMMIRNPKIMIFDDSLSAVDAETDQKIREAIRENTKDTTVILISHRITTLMQADQILVFDEGKLSEQGTHKELLKKDGIYKKIFDLQSRDL